MCLFQIFPLYFVAILLLAVNGLLLMRASLQIQILLLDVPTILHTRGVKLIQCCGPHLHTWILFGPDSVEKNLSRQDSYISGPRTLYFAGTGNRLIEFRSTPATALFGDQHFSGQQSPETV